MRQTNKVNRNAEKSVIMTDVASYLIMKRLKGRGRSCKKSVQFSDACFVGELTF